MQKISIIYIIVFALTLPLAMSAQRKNTNQEVPTIAWEATEPLGLRTPVPVDTLEDNYYRRSIPSIALSDAFCTTGNLGAEGKDMIFMRQQGISNFFLADAIKPWLPFHSNHIYYNSGQPRTQVSYNTGGGQDNSQDRLMTIFTANINPKAQFGANVDYLHSKGSYSHQAVKHLAWGFNGSYLGDRYEFQGAWYHYNSLNQENGGITDDLYITDPAQLQGGISSINPKSIPTCLSHARTRIKGGELFLNNRYKVGFWHEEYDSIHTDSVVYRTYIPVMSFIWNLNYNDGSHRFNEDNEAESVKYWENRYLSPSTTDDFTKYHILTNTVGISMLEGFNKYAKFGLAAYVTYELRKFTQTADTLSHTMPGLSPWPAGITSIDHKATENVAWVGAEITKQHGSILTYGASGEIGFLGAAAGEIKIKGQLNTRIPLFGDTVSVTGYGSFMNTSPAYLLSNYLSNHFIWQQDLGMERRLRLGGILNVPWTNTSVNIGTETMQHLVFFGENCMPVQHDGTVQVFAATLNQNFRFGILNWENRITFQTSTDNYVMPLPKLAVYSNLYIKCRIATLKLQLGVDCDYYTRYNAPAYQPALATFYNQRDIQVGNYPFMNVYANMKLGRTRFYVMMTHVNQGLIGGNNYFSSPHYPLNPRRLMLGLSVDFLN